MPLRNYRCDFLHCDYEGQLTLLVHSDGQAWELCPTHEKIVRKNGISFEYENGRKFVFSPVMLRGRGENAGNA